VTDADWTRIPFLPSRFEASRDGFVRVREYITEGTSRTGKKFPRRVPGHVLKTRINKGNPSNGTHPIVNIYEGTGRDNFTNREYRVAYLVAAAFHGIPYDRNDQREIQRWRIRFKDGDALNCSADNLEWIQRGGDDGYGHDSVGRYERNLDAWRATDPADVISRLFEEAA
jgi:hypothetical protein